MKRPSHVWGVFVLGLIVAIGGMIWLSVRVSELEQHEAERNHTADFEANVRLALRRMDSFIYQLLAEQSAWPYAAYQPTYALPAVGKQPGAVIPSPLRVSNSPLVKLYFQVTPEKTYTSPGIPMRGSQQEVASEVLSPEQIGTNTRLLSQLSRLVEPGELLAHCAPAKPLTPEAIAALAAPPVQALAPPVYSENDPFEPAPNQQAVAPPKQQAKVPQQAAQSDEQQSRSWADYNTRKQRYGSQVGNSVVQAQLRDNLNRDGGNNLLPPLAQASPAIVEGLSRPIWLGNELLLARRVNVGDETVIQGCWFNWPAIKEALRAEVADLFLPFGAAIDVVPVGDESKDDARMLATLQAQLIANAPPLAISAAQMTPVRLALMAAWIALAAAAAAAAVLLRGVMALSERRAAFVSAVTHELRTPLTTFRMYSEMLAEGMVPDETQRRHYLGTLKTEADRLFHLIENVLSYARLERGRRAISHGNAAVSELLAPMIDRLTERAARDDMQIQFALDPAVADASIRTDAGALEQILVNLVDNACKYAAGATDRRIHIDVTRQQQFLLLRVGDHGPGITTAEARGLFRPFTKSASQAAQTAPGVGLGLALSQRLAQDLGGKLELASPNDASGAVFTLKLPLSPS